MSVRLDDHPGNEEGVTLTVAEAVNNASTDAARLLDDLLQRLRLAHLLFEVSHACNDYG